MTLVNLKTMDNGREPIQIGSDLILCADKTLWKWSNGDFMTGASSGWKKLPPIPTDEQYEVQQEQRLKWEEAWMEAQTKRLRKLND